MVHPAASTSKKLGLGQSSSRFQHLHSPPVITPYPLGTSPTDPPQLPHTHTHRRSGSADKVNCRTCTFVDCTRVRQWPAQRVYINTGDTHNPRNYHTQPCAVLRLPSFIQSARKVEPRSKRRKKNYISIISFARSASARSVV